MKQFKLKAEFENKRLHIHGVGPMLLRDMPQKLIAANESQVGKYFDSSEAPQAANPEPTEASDKATAPGKDKSKGQNSLPGKTESE